MQSQNGQGRTVNRKDNRQSPHTSTPRFGSKLGNKFSRISRLEKMLDYSPVTNFETSTDVLVTRATLGAFAEPCEPHPGEASSLAASPHDHYQRVKDVEDVFDIAVRAEADHLEQHLYGEHGCEYVVQDLQHVGHLLRLKSATRVRATMTGWAGLTLSLPSTFSQLFKEKCIREVVRIGSLIIFHLSKR